MEFNEKETIKKIDEYIKINFTQPINNKQKNVFYNLKELWGWRFYLKALKHWDLASINSHIKKTLWLTQQK